MEAPKPLTPEEKARQKAANVERIGREVDDLLQLDASALPFAQCLEWHQRLRGKIVEMQGLAIKGLFDFKLVKEYEPKLVGKIHEVENRAHTLQSGAAGLPGASDRKPPH